MIAIAVARPSSIPHLRRPRALALSAMLHGLLLAAWMLAPAPSLRDPAAGAVTVQLLTEPPPPAPEPEPQAEPEPKPAPEKQPPQPVAPQRVTAKPTPRTKPAPATPAAPEPAAQPVMTDTPADTATAANTPIPAAVATATALGTPAGRSAERDDYLRMVWTRIMRFRPDRVPFAGTTRLRFTLSADGALVAVEVTDSSGSGLLDRAALDAVRRAAPFPPPLPGVPATALTFEIPFQFR